MSNMRKTVTDLVFAPGPLGVRALGRCLVIIYNNQIEVEKKIRTTIVKNWKGFTKGDAQRGTLDALYFLETGTLDEARINWWRKRNVNGVAKISKYWRQIEEAAANEKKAA